VSSAQLLPLAITMMAGPQILSAIIFVTAANPVKVSLSYVTAVAVAAAVATLVWYLLAGVLGNSVDLNDSSGQTTAAKVIQVALVGLLILASLKAYLGRQTAEPPKWLGKLQDATPGRAFRLGMLLIFLMPSDFVITMTTGLHLEANGASYWEALPFVGLTALIAAVPLLFYVLFRRRAQVAMPMVRDWMKANSWLVNIVVYAIFIALILG
jgi:Sap-like sulfolipid-1-addressing protein